MAPSVSFWIDTLANLVTGLVALSLLILVLGVGLRQRLNQSFVLFTICAALASLGTAIANLTQWLSSRVLADNTTIGDPLFWARLATWGFFLIGPGLLWFSATYVETLKSPTESPKTDWHKRLSILGFLIGLALLPVFFGPLVVSDFYLDQADLPRWELTNLGWGLSVGLLLYEAWAFVLFWQNRHRPGGSTMAFSTGIVLIGSLLGSVVYAWFPIFSFTYIIGILVMGHTVTSHQIFNPLRTLTERLEATVAERTQQLQKTRDKLQNLNEQQHKAARISRKIARMTDPSEMLSSLVKLIHDRLGYHHIYVYQPEESGHDLVLRAAAGTHARTVLEKGHRLPIYGRSLTGQVAVQHRARIAKARGDEATFFGDTLLPGARSEMALPLLAGDQLLGVLDFQSIHSEAFAPKDLTLMSTLADQVAATLYNARLFQETEAALVELEKARGQHLRQEWQSTPGGSERAPAYVYTEGAGVATTDMDIARSPEIVEAVTQSQPLVFKDAQPADEAQADTEDDGQDATPDVLALPIVVHDQVIGALQLRHKQGRAWQSEDVDALGEVAERLGLALETARLSQEARRHAKREGLIRRITDRMQRATDLESLMRITAEELNVALNASRAYIRMGTETDLSGWEE